MSEDTFRYDQMVENALRSVVREALIHVRDKGLPGEHHFYITFDTEMPGVTIPPHLKARYPEEMTIVVQHQFWSLNVEQDKFSITLSFADVPERLVVPFEAVTAFADPSVRFGLQFDSKDDELDDAFIAGEENGQDAAAKAVPDIADLAQDDAANKVVALDAFRKK